MVSPSLTDESRVRVTVVLLTLTAFTELAVPLSVNRAAAGRSAAVPLSASEKVMRSVTPSAMTTAAVADGGLSVLLDGCAVNDATALPVGS